MDYNIIILTVLLFYYYCIIVFTEMDSLVLLGQMDDLEIREIRARLVLWDLWDYPVLRVQRDHRESRAIR